MAIVFDGNGSIGGFRAALTGDFEVILPTIEVDGSYKAIFGSNNSDTFLQIRPNETRFRFNGGSNTIDLPPTAIGTVVSDGRITRVDGVLTITFNGNTGSTNNTGTVDIRNWGSMNGGSFFVGKMSGVASITGDTDGVITHDFDGGVEGDTQLTNTSGDYDHGTLSGFTTGGFEGSATPTPSIADAGADQSNINAGETVTLDSSASTGVVSRLWSEVTSTGVVLSDDTAISPTFTAPSFTELTEITFRVTTTGSDGTTDFDDVSFFVLEDGVVATDPTISILTPYTYQTKKADSLFEAIFTLSGVITDLPAGAVAEYQVDNGNWIQAATDSNGNYSTDVVIYKQQRINVRVSTHPTVTATVGYVTAANVWLAWWQSNESGRGSSTQNSVRNELGAEDFRPTMFRDGTWQRLADPTSEDSTGGSTWVRIAVEFAKIGIPIGVINVAVGGTSLERWIPSSSDLWDSRIIAETTEADCGGVTFTASLGGESNVGTDPATMRLWLEEMINALYSEFGSVHYLTDIPRTYANGESDNLRAEFDYIIENNPYCRFGGDTEVVDLTTSGDGTHLNSGSQVNEAALIRFAAFTAEQAEENQPPTANAGPDQSVAAGVLVQLSASGSSDNDGTIVGYKWRETTNSGVVLSSTAAENISFTSPVSDTAQTVTLELIVTDDGGLDSAPVYVDFNVAAEVDTTPPVIILTGGNIALNVGELFQEPGYQAFNNKGVDITDQVTVTGSTSTAFPRTGTLEYNVVADGIAAETQTRIFTVTAESELLEAVSKQKFLRDNTVISAFTGRSNIEELKFKLASTNAKIALDNQGYYDFDENETQKVIVVTDDGEISSENGDVEWEGSSLFVRFGAFSSRKSQLSARVVVFLAGDERGVVIAGPGLNANLLVKFN
jgi:hypothetical protein